MAKEIVFAGTTSYLTHFFARKTSVATGAGQGGLTASQISASYIRLGAAAPVAVPLVTATLGTFTSGGIATVLTTAVPNSTGLYEFHPPNAAFAAGARMVTFFLSDAGNSDSWEPVQLAFQVVADDPSTRLFDVSTLTMTVVASIGKRLLDALDTNIASRLSPDGTLDVVTNVTTVTGNVTGSVGSVTGAVGSVTGAVGSVVGDVGGNVVGTVASVVGAVGSVTGNVGGNVVGSAGSVVGAVGSVTGAVGSVTGNVGGNVVGTVGSVVGAVGSVTAGVSVAAGGFGDTAATGAAVERIADTVLRRDWTAITAEPALRSLWNAARFLRNAWTTTEIAGRIVIKRENDATTAWDANLGTDAAAVPIVSNDPTA